MKTDFKKMFTTAKNFMNVHKSEILTGLGIASMLTGTVMAVKATPKAIMLMNEREVEEHREDFTPVEKFKTTWKCYIPSTLFSIMGTSCLIFACSENCKRNAALAAAYSLSESALQTYQSKVVETVGEKKEQIVQDAVNKEIIEKHPTSETNIVKTIHGDTLCFDPMTARYFTSDIEYIIKIVNDLNSRLLDEMTIPLNDLYYELGLEEAKLGENIGWDTNKGLIEMNFNSQLTDKYEPCLVLVYNVTPIW